MMTTIEIIADATLALINASPRTPSKAALIAAMATSLHPARMQHAEQWRRWRSLCAASAKAFAAYQDAQANEPDDARVDAMEALACDADDRVVAFCEALWAQPPGDADILLLADTLAYWAYNCTLSAPDADELVSGTPNGHGGIIDKAQAALLRAIMPAFLMLSRA
jgi:hypothetical protein